MRAVFIVLMIALLPLRSWLGDAMATQMMGGAAFATETIATDQDDTWARGVFSLKEQGAAPPCHEAAENTGMAVSMPTPAASSMSEDVADHTNCSNCNTSTSCGDCQHCQLCQLGHSVALSPLNPALPLLALAARLAPGGLPLFASAHSAPHLKPPIA